MEFQLLSLPEHSNVYSYLKMSENNIPVVESGSYPSRIEEKRHKPLKRSTQINNENTLLGIGGVSFLELGIIQNPKQHQKVPQLNQCMASPLQTFFFISAKPLRLFRPCPGQQKTLRRCRLWRWSCSVSLLSIAPKGSVSAFHDVCSHPSIVWCGQPVQCHECSTLEKEKLEQMQD